MNFDKNPNPGRTKTCLRVLEDAVEEKNDGMAGKVVDIERMTRNLKPVYLIFCV